VNLTLLTELQEWLQRIEAIPDTSIDEKEQAFDRLLSRVAQDPGRDSAEYGLSLRARASMYRNRGDYVQAAAEYARALPLIERGGDPTLIQEIETLISLTGLYLRIGDRDKSIESAQNAIDLMAKYAREPRRFLPLEFALQSGSENNSFPPPEAMVVQFTRGLAEALLIDAPGPAIDLRITRALGLFDSLISKLAGITASKLRLLLAKGSFAVDHGRPAIEIFADAWAFVNPTGQPQLSISANAWADLGLFAIACNRTDEAFACVRKLRELTPEDDGELLANLHNALRLETSIYLAGHDPAATEAVLERLREFAISTFGRDSDEILEAEALIARFLVEQQRPSEARELLRHIVTLRASNSSAPDLLLADAFFDLAYCLDKSDSDIEAMEYYAAAYRTYTQLLPPGDPKAIHAAIDLAETARVVHDYESAERWFRITLDAEQKARGRDTATAAHALNNLAETLIALGRADEAAPMAAQGLKIREALFGKQSSEYQRSQGVVLSVALARGQTAEVSQLLDEMRAASPSGAIQLTFETAVQIYELRGDVPTAIKVCEDALKTLSTNASRHSESMLPGQEMTLHFKLGQLHARLGRWSEAKKQMLSAFQSETIFLSDECGHRSRRQVGLLLGESRKRIAGLMRILIEDPQTTPEELKSAYEVLQQRKGIETRLLRMQKPSFVTNPALTVLQPGSPDRLDEVRDEMQRMVERLRSARRDWIWALISQAREMPPDPNAPSILGLQDQVEFSERRLAEYVGQNARDWELIGLLASTPAVSADSAIVEYVLVEDPTPAYYAFVIRANHAVQLRSLGDARSIDQALAQLRSQIIDGSPRPGDPDPAWRRRARFLSNRLLLPLLDLLEGGEQLYIVPDGELFTLPFDLLPLDEENLAIDKWTITHLWNGGELAGAKLILGSPVLPSEPVVISGPAMDGGSPSEATAGSRWKFARLPFAEEEGNNIAAILGAIHLTNESATKDAVLAREGAEMLHLATHSFYIPREIAGASSGLPDTLLHRARAVLADPMERSGVALAGADLELNTPTRSSAGILFASEVLDMDLRGTDLAVLSSCQSGLGDSHPGDGIQGLRRAFRAAGARTVVSSLWKVPDKATCDFMTDFYNRLMQQVKRGQALREAKLALRTTYSSDPLLWAGFVLDGADDAPARFNPVNRLKVANITGIGFSYGLAMEHYHKQEWSEAIADFDIVLTSRTADDSLRAEAGFGKACALRNAGRLDDALQEFDRVIVDSNTPEETQRQAIAARGVTHQMLGDSDNAYLDYTSLLELPNLPDAERAWVLVNRSMVLIHRRQWEKAIVDCDAVLSNPASPVDQQWKALLNRAESRRGQDNLKEAIEDAAALIAMPEAAGSTSSAGAYLILALCHLRLNQPAAAIDDLRKRMQLPAASQLPGLAEKLSACERLLENDLVEKANARLMTYIKRLAPS
jgi:CHAT domain-containing protein